MRCSGTRSLRCNLNSGGFALFGVFLLIYATAAQWKERKLRTAKALACPFILLFSPRLCARDVFIAAVVLREKKKKLPRNMQVILLLFITTILFDPNSFRVCKNTYQLVHIRAHVYIFIIHTRRRD